MKTEAKDEFNSNSREGIVKMEHSRKGEGNKTKEMEQLHKGEGMNKENNICNEVRYGMFRKYKKIDNSERKSGAACKCPDEPLVLNTQTHTHIRTHTQAQRHSVRPVCVCV